MIIDDKVKRLPLTGKGIYGDEQNAEVSSIRL